MSRLEINASLTNLGNTVRHHYLHIKNRHAFMRAWAVQFEIAYTDFRIVELALQLQESVPESLQSAFSTTYSAIYAYEYAFAAEGLDGFNAKFNEADLTHYGTLVDEFGKLIEQIQALTNEGSLTDDK